MELDGQKYRLNSKVKSARTAIEILVYCTFEWIAICSDTYFTFWHLLAYFLTCPKKSHGIYSYTAGDS